MTRNSAKAIYRDVQQQFDILEKLADEIVRLNKEAEQKQDTGLKVRALELAKILDELSESSYELGKKVRDRAA